MRSFGPFVPSFFGCLTLGAPPVKQHEQQRIDSRDLMRSNLGSKHFVSSCARIASPYCLAYCYALLSLSFGITTVYPVESLSWNRCLGDFAP